MTTEEIFQFINSNPVCHLATIEGHKPHVRAMFIYRADQDGIIFHSGNSKDLHKQLINNPQVELCFNNNDSGTQIRVSGVVEIVNDPALKDEIIKERDFLKPWIEERGDEFLIIYRVKNMLATIWTLQTNFDAKNLSM